MNRPLTVLMALVCAAVASAGCSHTTGPRATSNRTPPQTSTSQSSTASTASTTSGTVSPGAAICSRVTATPGQTQGAAGTITGTITTTNSGSTPCTMMGYPTMAMFYPAGGALPVTMVNGLTVQISAAANAPPALVTLAPSAQAEFTYQYSDVPSGSETSCPSSTMVSVTTPGAPSETAHFPLMLAPCEGGTIRVSPMYALG